MRVKHLAASVIACAVLQGTGLRADANDRALRTGPDDTYVVFGNGNNDAEAFLGRAGETQAPVKIPLPRSSWIVDALIDDARRLWLALGANGREGAVQMFRWEGQKGETFEVGGTTASSSDHLLGAGGTVYLADPAGLWSVSGQQPKKIHTWDVTFNGFYAASLSRAASGWQLLVPDFNTCTSSDILEQLWLFEPGPTSRMEHRAIPLPTGAMGRAWFGADGRQYGVGCDGDVGVLGHHGAGRSWPVLHREPAPNCRYDLQQNGRFTIVAFGLSLVRVDHGRVERLGVVDQPAVGGASRGIEAFYPDWRGRAVVLRDDGSIVRHSSKQPPEVIGRVAARAD